VVEETSAVMRAEEKKGLNEPRLLQSQTPVRSNLIMKSRHIDPGTELLELAAKLTEELMQHMPGLSNIRSQDFSFEDGQAGYLIAFEVQATPRLRVKQHHVLRIDVDYATQFTLTTGVDAKPEVLAGYLESIARSTRANAESKETP
jgi:hypothetical protein